MGHGENLSGGNPSSPKAFCRWFRVLKAIAEIVASAITTSFANNSFVKAGGKCPQQRRPTTDLLTSAAKWQLTADLVEAAGISKANHLNTLHEDMVIFSYSIKLDHGAT